jgi:hypothetical protein
MTKTKKIFTIFVMLVFFAVIAQAVQDTINDYGMFLKALPWNGISGNTFLRADHTSTDFYFTSIDGNTNYNRDRNQEDITLDYYKWYMTCQTTGITEDGTEFGRFGQGMGPQGNTMRYPDLNANPGNRDLVTIFTGLTVGQEYHVGVVYGGDMGVSTSKKVTAYLTDNTPVTFAHQDADIIVDDQSNSWRALDVGYLGIAVADSQGQIHVNVDIGGPFYTEYVGIVILDNQPGGGDDPNDSDPVQEPGKIYPYSIDDSFEYDTNLQLEQMWAPANSLIAKPRLVTTARSGGKAILADSTGPENASNCQRTFFPKGSDNCDVTLYFGNGIIDGQISNYSNMHIQFFGTSGTLHLKGPAPTQTYAHLCMPGTNTWFADSAQIQIPSNSWGKLRLIVTDGVPEIYLNGWQIPLPDTAHFEFQTLNIGKNWNSGMTLFDDISVGCQRPREIAPPSNIALNASFEDNDLGVGFDAAFWDNMDGLGELYFVSGFDFARTNTVSSDGQYAALISESGLGDVANPILVSYIFQDIQNHGGKLDNRQLTFKADVRKSSLKPLSVGEEIAIEIYAINYLGLTLDSSEYVLPASQLVDEWVDVSCSLEIPADTTVVSCRLTLRTEILDGSTVYFDNVEILAPVLPGDFNEDQELNLQDIAVFALEWGVISQDASEYNMCDLDKNGVVDIEDLIILAEYWLMVQ